MKEYKKAYIEITNVCNKNCSFCHKTKREPRFMAKEEFERVVSEVSPFTDYIYLHLLGEPLLHPDLFDFVKISKDKGLKVTLTTNGTLLKELCDKILESGVYKVQISLHSFENGDITDYLTSVAHFSKESSKRGILTVLRLWNEGTDADNTVIEDFLKNAFPGEWKKGRDKNFTLSKNLFLEYAPRFEWPDKKRSDEKENIFCMALRDQFGILADGTVVPCCLDAEGDIALGNVFDTPLRDVLSCERAGNIKNSFSKRYAIEELCKKCPYARRF